MLKKGDLVVMHTCGEADHYKGKIWTCKTDEFTSSAKQQVVFLEGFSGYFLVDYLQIVDLKQIKDEIWKRVFSLTVDIEYAKGYEKKFLLGKYEAFAEVWKLLGGEVQVEEV